MPVLLGDASPDASNLAVREVGDIASDATGSGWGSSLLVSLSMKPQFVLAVDL